MHTAQCIARQLSCVLSEALPVGCACTAKCALSGTTRLRAQTRGASAASSPAAAKRCPTASCRLLISAAIGGATFCFCRTCDLYAGETACSVDGLAPTQRVPGPGQCASPSASPGWGGGLVCARATAGTRTRMRWRGEDSSASSEEKRDSSEVMPGTRQRLRQLRISIWALRHGIPAGCRGVVAPFSPRPIAPVAAANRSRHR